MAWTAEAESKSVAAGTTSAGCIEQQAKRPTRDAPLSWLRYLRPMFSPMCRCLRRSESFWTECTRSSVCTCSTLRWVRHYVLPFPTVCMSQQGAGLKSADGSIPRCCSACRVSQFASAQTRHPSARRLRRDHKLLQAPCSHFVWPSSIPARALRAHLMLQQMGSGQRNLLQPWKRWNAALKAV